MTILLKHLCAKVSLLAVLLALLAMSVSGCSIFGDSTFKSTAKTSGAVSSSRPYSINGVTYYPLTSVDKFEENGLASWYGPNFHGKKTANGEVYNMYAMTAAHKILPLNCTVRVTNLSNGKSALVRVNDRGPFVDKRVIDLSYAAANAIGVVGPGTAPVRVSLVSGGKVPSSPVPSKPAQGPFYVQIGSFSVKSNAQKLTANMRQEGFSGTRMKDKRSLWLVQVGMFGNLNQAQAAHSKLAKRFPGSVIIAAD